jgi:hypothetical protein
MALELGAMEELAVAMEEVPEAMEDALEAMEEVLPVTVGGGGGRGGAGGGVEMSLARERGKRGLR